MKKIVTLVGVSFFLFFIGSVMYSRNSSNAIANEIIVYQSRTCGCCKKWVSHLKDNGFKVKSELMDDISSVKVGLKIPMQVTSCHTAVINGYVVEGHVPAIAIKKLLKEKPKLKGLAVPGMPMGSPGMEGSYDEPYSVISFDESGSMNNYMNFN